MNNLQTPLEKLISDRQRIQKECAMQEQKLNDDFSYIQENAGNLLLSGMSAILFPNSKTKSKSTDPNQPSSSVPATPTAPLGFSDLISVAQSLLPVAWDVARPLLMTWGIRKAQAWILNTLFRKKKKK